MSISVPQLPGKNGAAAFQANRISMLLADVMQMLHKHRATFDIMNTSSDGLSIVFERREGGHQIDFSSLADDLAQVGIVCSLSRLLSSP